MGAVTRLVLPSNENGLIFSRMASEPDRLAIGSRFGPLIAATLFVVGVGTIVMGEDSGLPSEVINTLEIRELVFLSRTIPPGLDTTDLRDWTPETATNEGQKATTNDPNAPPDAPELMAGKSVAVALLESLEEIAHKPLPDHRDRMRGAALAVSVGARHLVPVFLARSYEDHEDARILVDWAFDPSYTIGTREIETLGHGGLDKPLADMVTAVFGAKAGLTDLTVTAEGRWQGRFDQVVTQGAILLVVGLGVLILGLVMWARTRRLQFLALAEENPSLTWPDILPVIQTLVYFMAAFLAANTLAPAMLESLGMTENLPLAATLIYGSYGFAGLFLAYRYGRNKQEQTFTTVVGWDYSAGRGSLVKSIGWAGAGYAMVWPVVMFATALSSMFGGAGANTFDNPMALFLATEPDGPSMALLLFSVAIMAPVFEEQIFRGFLYRRIRKHMTPYAAAMISGLVFAVAHLSLANILPLWAIGFALALAYEHSRSLLTPILIHSAWNLGTAISLLVVFG